MTLKMKKKAPWTDSKARRRSEQKIIAKSIALAGRRHLLNHSNHILIININLSADSQIVSANMTLPFPSTFSKVTSLGLCWSRNTRVS
jgi:hypothetical protein